MDADELLLRPHHRLPLRRLWLALLLLLLKVLIIDHLLHSWYLKISYTALPCNIEGFDYIPEVTNLWIKNKTVFSTIPFNLSILNDQQFYILIEEFAATVKCLGNPNWVHSPLIWKLRSTPHMRMIPCPETRFNWNDSTVTCTLLQIGILTYWQTRQPTCSSIMLVSMFPVTRQNCLASHIFLEFLRIKEADLTSPVVHWV